MQKSFSTILFYATLILLAFATLAVIPNFTLPLGEYQLRWQGLSSLGISDNLFNFTRGSGIYAKTAVEVEAQKGANEQESFELAFNRDKITLLRKLALVNSVLGADVYVREYLPSPAKRTFTFEFPQKIGNPETLVTNLLRQSNAVIAISTDQSSGGVDNNIVRSIFPNYYPSPSALNLSDVVSFSVDTSTVVRFPVLRTVFSSDAEAALQATFNAANYDPNTGNPILPVLLMVNGYPEFWAFHPDLFGSSQTTGRFPTNVMWIPLVGLDKTELVINAVSIFGEPIQLSYSEPEVSKLNAEYAPEGSTFIAGSVIGLFGLIVLLTWRRYGRLAASYYTLAYITTLLSIVALAKLAALSVDPPFVVTFVIFMLVIGVWGWRLLVTNLDKLAWELSRGVHLSLIMLALSAILFQFPLARVLRGYELLFILSVGFLLGVAVYFRAAISMYYHHIHAK